MFDTLASITTKPWIHYIPIKTDLSDFKEKLEWAKSNDKELRRIA